MSIVHPQDVTGPTIYGCAQAGCQECLNGLMRRHERLVHTVLRRQSSGPLSYAELLQAGRIGLWQAVLHFDSARGVAFSTYAGVAIERRLWQAVKQAQRTQGSAPLSLVLSASDARWQRPPADARQLAEEQLGRQEVVSALAAAIVRLPDREQQVLLALCGWDGQAPRNLSQIGAQWGVSRQAVTYWYHKALISLRLPAVAGRLRQLCDQTRRSDYQRSQALNRTWRRGRRGRQRR
jgi:RNA polymerase sigma factor (sigma-70 family)